MTNSPANEIGPDFDPTVDDELPQWRSAVPLQYLKGDMLGVDGIAIGCRVHPNTVRRWIERGDLPALVFANGRVVVRKDDFIEFLAPKPYPVKKKQG